MLLRSAFMQKLNNFFDNLEVNSKKKDWQTQYYEDIVQNMNNNLNSSDATSIQKPQGIEDIVDDILSTIENSKSWQDIVNLIKNHELVTVSRPNNNNYNNEKKDQSLSRTEILSFCGKLLDILKSGNIPLKKQNNKYAYVATFFTVKNKIAKIQNELLALELLSRNYGYKDQNTITIFNAKKEEWRKLIDANYQALQSSINDYEQLDEEIAEASRALNNKIAVFKTVHNQQANEQSSEKICRQLEQINGALQHQQDIPRNILNNNNKDVFEELNTIHKKYLEKRKLLLKQNKDIINNIRKICTNHAEMKNDNNAYLNQVCSDITKIEKELILCDGDLAYCNNGLTVCNDHISNMSSELRMNNDKISKIDKMIEKNVKNYNDCKKKLEAYKSASQTINQQSSTTNNQNNTHNNNSQGENLQANNNIKELKEKQKLYFNIVDVLIKHKQLLYYERYILNAERFLYIFEQQKLNEQLKQYELKKNLLTKQFEQIIIKEYVKEQLKNFFQIFCNNSSKEMKETLSMKETPSILKECTANELLSNIGTQIFYYACEMATKKGIVDINDIEGIIERKITQLDDIKNQPKNQPENQPDYNPDEVIQPKKSSFMDSICCSICADEPIAYALKNINGKENMEFLQEKYINNNNDEDSSNSSEIKSKIENLQTKDANKHNTKKYALKNINDKKNIEYLKKKHANNNNDENNKFNIEKKIEDLKRKDVNNSNSESNSSSIKYSYNEEEESME